MSKLVIIPLGEPAILCESPTEEMINLVKGIYNNHIIKLDDKIIKIPSEFNTKTLSTESTNSASISTEVEKEEIGMDVIPLRVITPTTTTPTETTEGKVKRTRRTKAEMEALRNGTGTPVTPPAVVHTEVPVPPMESPTPPVIVPTTSIPVPEIEQDIVEGANEDLFNDK